MPIPRPSSALLNVLLLVVLLVVVGVALAVLGSVVLLPQGGALVVLLAAGVLFLGVQLLVFRWLGLRSDADKAPEDEEPAEDDWRAWRG